MQLFCKLAINYMSVKVFNQIVLYLFFIIITGTGIFAMKNCNKIR